MLKAHIAPLLIILSLINYAIAGCHYWDGTAPFCSGSCPSGCRKESTSKCGNGACCVSGRKALCNCCSGPSDGPCRPTQTETSCFGGGFIPWSPMICRNVEVIAFPPSKKTCSTYICGVCFFGKKSVATEEEVEAAKLEAARQGPFLARIQVGMAYPAARAPGECDPVLNVTNVAGIYSDLYTQGEKDLSEKEIEKILVAKFGRMIPAEELKDAHLIRFLPPQADAVEDSDCAKK